MVNRPCLREKKYQDEFNGNNLHIFNCNPQTTLRPFIFYTKRKRKNLFFFRFLIIRPGIEKRIIEVWFLICFLEKLGFQFG